MWNHVICNLTFSNQVISILLHRLASFTIWTIVVHAESMQSHSQSTMSSWLQIQTVGVQLLLSKKCFPTPVCGYNRTTPTCWVTSTIYNNWVHNSCKSMFSKISTEVFTCFSPLFDSICVLSSYYPLDQSGWKSKLPLIVLESRVYLLLLIYQWNSFWNRD